MLDLLNMKFQSLIFIAFLGQNIALCVITSFTYCNLLMFLGVKVALYLIITSVQYSIIVVKKYTAYFVF